MQVSCGVYPEVSAQSDVRADETQVRQYIREQEKEDRRLDQLKMFE
jgi:hypothetical protein